MSEDKKRWSKADYVARAIAMGIYAIETAQPSTFQGRAMSPEEVIQTAHEIREAIDPCDCYALAVEHLRYEDGEVTRVEDACLQVRLHGDHYRITVKQTSAVDQLANLLFAEL